MPIGLTAGGEIVFPWECRELIEKQRGPISAAIPTQPKDASPTPATVPASAPETISEPGSKPADEGVAKSAVPPASPPEPVAAAAEPSISPPAVVPATEPADRRGRRKKLAQPQQNRKPKPSDKDKVATGGIFSRVVGAVK